MPFVIKDVLQYKLNDRQIREIHEKEYSKYLTNLRQQPQQQQQNLHYFNQYHLPISHIKEVERSLLRNISTKQHQYDRIQRENYVLYDRLLKASKQSVVDDKNLAYQQNLDTFNSKRLQHRFHEYKRIYNDNQIILQRLTNVRGHLINKQQCDNDWKKHVNFMKKNCDYPENVDKFISKMNKTQQKQTCLYNKMKIEQSNNQHCINKSLTELTITPLAILLDES